MIDLKHTSDKKPQGNYMTYLDRYVMVHTQSKTAIGKIIFTDFETTLLCPSLINEGIEKHRVYRIETTIPTTINTPAIQIIEHTRPEYLEEIIDYYKEHPEEETKK